MRLKAKICCFTFILLSISLSLWASDLKVSDVTLSSTNWGDQTASFNLSNMGEDYKFVVAVSEISNVDGTGESPKFTKKAYFIEPSSEQELVLPITISAGYGKIEIGIKLYDVIDTLDQVFDSQMFFTKVIPVEFKVSDKMKNEILDDLTFPKFVENNDLFDDYFSRMLLTLLYNKKSTKEIAELCGTDITFINSIINEYSEAGIISVNGTSAKINFMAIDKNHAEMIVPVVNKTIENLYGVLSNNFQAYDDAISSLVSQGRLTADKFDALDMGAILYQKYPVTLGLFLWDILGREFVNDGHPFNIFEGSDPCNAVMGDYMYMMVGAENYIGDSYYYSTGDSNNNVIYCGLGNPNFICPSNYRESAKKKRPVRLGFDFKNPDKIYLFNDEKIREPLSVLMDGTIESVEKLKSDMANIFAGTYFDTNHKGARYWCWDMVVTKLMAKLVENNVIEKDNTHLYRLQKTDY
ncbi:MAG: replication protein [candidate division Zixibacteria bacterium]|nr:replication protein [candidate division Zixibacteria bacterium]